MTIGKEVEQEKWHLPAKFLTPEVLAAAEEEQKRLAAAFNLPFGTISAQERERALAGQRAEHLERTLESLKRNDPETEQISTALKHQLAEAYALTGRYDLAAELEPDPAYARGYSEILQAVFREDDEWCDCGDHHGTGTHANVVVPSAYVKKEIFSMKTNAPAYLIACSKCPMMNVTEIPDALRQQRAARARAQQMVGGLSPKEAEAILQRAGHTTERLLKK